MRSGVLFLHNEDCEGAPFSSFLLSCECMWGGYLRKILSLDKIKSGGVISCVDLKSSFIKFLV